jgi:multimeric flavodoxin WrbA
MTAHILGVVGSPRRNGNTHVLVSEALDGAARAGARSSILLLGDLDVRECDGCHACWSGKDCPRDDDMNGLYRTIAESDAIVFGTPVYWYGPTGLMKLFIDRLVYFNCPENRPKIRNKPVAVVVPFEEADPRAADLVLALFERSFRYLEMRPVGKLVVPGVTRLGEVRDQPDRLGEARRLGEALAAAI